MSQEKVIPWEEDFPSGLGQTSIDFIRNHGNRELFMLAKAGDEIAAVELARKCIKKDRATGLYNQYPDAVILPVMAKERTGYNVIPLAYAKVMSSISDYRVYEDVFQINCPQHTGACEMERLINRPMFDGKVQEGYNYIILDDVVTQGGTVSSLRRFINSEARYLLKFRDVDAIRNRAYEIGVQRILKETGRVFKEKSHSIDRVL